MAINFPSNPTNAQEVTEGNVTYVYNATKGYWESSEVSSGGGASITVYADMTALIAATGMSDGDQAFVTANNNLYLYSGTGWYKIATVQNDSPSAITGVDGTYSLAIDGTPTVITAVSTDPEGFPLTWTYSTSGLGSIATVSQADNVFTITPSTDDANFGTFTLTINATDGVNGAVSANTSITLQFHILNSNYTTLLAAAVDTSDNNNITDSSTNNHTITVNGDTHAGTFSPYRHGGYSYYFDGTGDNIQLPSSNAFAYGTGDFTWEGWINVPSAVSNHYVLEHGVNGGTITVANNIVRYYNQTTGVGSNLYSGATINYNTWHHVAVVRSSGTTTLYLDGTAEQSASDSHNYAASNVLIGQYGGSTQYNFTGYIKDVRIIKGTAVYTADFTPPTERLTAIANTSLLTCHLPYIADGSSNDHSITVNGNTSIKPFTPFDNLEYSESINGGSVYFDGTGDYLSITSASIPSGSSPYTVEAWIYFTTLSSRAQITFWGSTSTNNSNGFRLNDAGNGFLNWWYANDLDTGDIGIKSNAWYHVAATWDGTTRRIFVNGALEASDTPSSPNVTANSTLVIGAQNNTDFFHGNISDLRILSEALYTSAFTPPTAPLAAVTNTSLLVSATDASVIDKSQTNNLQLVGNTTGSTTQAKFANTKSMYFDGSGDYVSIASNPAFGFGTGDFTIEFWTYWGGTLNTGNGGAFVGLRSAVAAEALVVYLSTSGEIHFYDGPANVEVGSGVTITQEWTHIALTRESGLWRIFVNGTLSATRNSSTDLGSSKPCRIGQAVNGTTTSYHGYIQDLRVTKGLARYTANFTPPTEPLKG